MIRWTEDAIRFMKNASERGAYYPKLAERIAARLDKRRGCICDAGCGLGYLSLEMARLVDHVVAVDIHPDAVSVLRENAEKRSIRNLTALCADAEQFKPKSPYDAMIFCFFGGLDTVLRIAQRQCSGDVFVISRNYGQHRFSVGRHSFSAGGYQEICRRLAGMGVPFESETMTLDFSQPLANLDDARRFFELYSKDEREAITDAFLLSRLNRTEDKTFRYILPHEREVGLVHIRVEDLKGRI